MRCPICKEQARANHSPYGHCDNCAEEYGCDCGCTPSPILRIISEGDSGAVFEREDTYWTVTFTDPFGREVTVRD